MQIDEVFRDQRGNNEKLKTYKLVVAGRCPLQHIPFLLQSNMPVHTRTHIHKYTQIGVQSRFCSKHQRWKGLSLILTGTQSRD